MVLLHINNNQMRIFTLTYLHCFYCYKSLSPMSVFNIKILLYQLLCLAIQYMVNLNFYILASNFYLSVIGKCYHDSGSLNLLRRVLCFFIICDIFSHISDYNKLPQKHYYLCEEYDILHSLEI